MSYYRSSNKRAEFDVVELTLKTPIQCFSYLIKNAQDVDGMTDFNSAYIVENL